jgi:HK97 family phage major capsid protein
MYRIHARDKRRWFQIHCCNSVVKVDPAPQPNIAFALGCALTLMIAVVIFGATFHLLTITASAGSLLANAPITTPEIKDLTGRLDTLLTQMKEAKAAGAEQEKKYGTMLTSQAESITAIQKQLDAIDVKLAENHAAAAPKETVFETLSKHEPLQKWMKDRPLHSCIVELTGKQVQELLERKTTIDTGAVGRSTSGVMPIDRTPGIVQEARQRLYLRDLLSSRPTVLSDIDYVKVNSAPSRASMQTESSSKTENAVTFNTGTARVQTIATWIPASRQVLDDMSELLGYLRTALPYYVNLAEEVQFLTGSNTGQDLNGLVTQGTAYNTALNTNSPGWKKQDVIARAIQQVEIAKEIEPTFVALHPTDYWDIKLTKDTQGRYLNPNGNDTFWGLQPVRTTCLGSGNFLVGSGDPAAVEIRDRMAMTLELSTQHASYFVQNLVAIRAEKRAALVCYRPGSFIQGSLNTSP